VRDNEALRPAATIFPSSISMSRRASMPLRGSMMRPPVSIVRVMLVSSVENSTSSVTGAVGYDAARALPLHPESKGGQCREADAGEKDEVKGAAGDRGLVRLREGKNGAHLTERIRVTVHLDLAG
jgi:hypothetical protein